MAETSIEWTDATWNPVTGCTWASPGCDNCYAAKMTRRLESMGHQKYAGRVTEETIGGASFVRIDVPETPRAKPFTKYFGTGAIFSITPVEGDVACMLAARYDHTPVNVYELPESVRQALKSKLPLDYLEDSSDDDDDSEY